MAKERKMYIDGTWVGALDGEVYQDLNPYTEEVYAVVPAGKRADAERAVKAAATAFPSWARTLPAERQSLFLRAAEILERKREECIEALQEETGCALGFATFQTSFTPGLLREAAAQAHQATGEIVPSDLPGSLYMARRQPVGVVAGIGPWNAPLILSLRSICMPIAYGNTAVLKPSTESAVAGGTLIAEVFHEAGFPRGVLNVVTNGPGKSGELGDELIENQKVRRINLTGSSAVGRRIAERAGRHLKRVALELGGQNPMIVLRDADVEGPCYLPTVLVDVKADTPFCHEETFGPVVSIVEVANEEHALEVANETSYGLSASVMTRDLAKGLDLAERIESGIVHINDQTVHDEPQVPFGGVKDSGWGRFGGRAALEEFTELRWISLQCSPRQYPF